MASILKDYYYPDTYDTHYPFISDMLGYGLPSEGYRNWQAAQLFTTSSSYSAYSAKIRGFRVGSDLTPVVTCSIQTVAGGIPSGSSLCYGTLPSGDFSTSPGGTYEFIFNTNPTLEEGTTYAIVLSISFSLETYINLQGKLLGDYNGGYYLDRGLPDISWTPEITFPYIDLYFETWGVSRPSKAVNPLPADLSENVSWGIKTLTWELEE